MPKEKKLELFDVSVAETSGGIAPAIVLRNKEEFLPIYVGLSEAISTNSGIKNEEPFRPFAHDIILRFLEKKDIDVKKVLIDDLEEGIYFAQLVLEQDSEEIKIDSRPSDGIAIAVREDAEIKIKSSILEKASRGKEEIKERMRSLDNYLG